MCFPHTQQRCAPLDLRTLGQLFAPGNIQVAGKKAPAAGRKYSGRPRCSERSRLPLHRTGISPSSACRIISVFSFIVPASLPENTVSFTPK